MQPWQTQADGRLSRTLGSLTMVVHPNPVQGAIRFIVFRDITGRPSQMIASGHEDNVGSAITAVQKLAARLMEN